MTRHLTPAEKRTRANAAAAVARALTHTRTPPRDDDQRLGELYPYVTHARARQIRQEIEETRHDR